MARACLECGKNLTGRRDKKFCDHHCRSSYHYRVTEDFRQYVLSIHKIIKRNRDILASFSKSGTPVVSLITLRSAGFQFTYLSNERSSVYEKKIRCCYDFGYTYINDEHVKIHDFSTLSEEQPHSSLHSVF